MRKEKLTKALMQDLADKLSWNVPQKNDIPNIRRAVQKGFRTLGRDAVITSGLMTLGVQRVEQRVDGVCMCFVGTALTGEVDIDSNPSYEDVAMVADSVKEQPEIEVVYWLHTTDEGARILEQEFEKFIGAEVVDLQLQCGLAKVVAAEPLAQVAQAS